MANGAASKDTGLSAIPIIKKTNGVHQAKRGKRLVLKRITPIKNAVATPKSSRSVAASAPARVTEARVTRIKRFERALLRGPCVAEPVTGNVARPLKR